MHRHRRLTTGSRRRLTARLSKVVGRHNKMSALEIAEFQRRRKSWLRCVMPFMALFLLGALLGITTARYEIGFYFAVIAFIGWSYFTWRLYRCPRCNTMPSAGEGIAINPKFCAKCGAQLRANV